MRSDGIERQMFRSLKGQINLIGSVLFAAYACLAFLSFFHAAVLWSGPQAPRAVIFFRALGDSLGGSDFAAGLGSLTIAILSYWLLLAVASIAVLILSFRLNTAPAEAGTNGDKVSLVFRWAVSFAVVNFFSFPVFTQDMWLSAAWGRMIVAGVNPYEVPFSPPFLTGLPLDHFPMTMSYGPLWAAISASVMALSGESVLIAGMLFKALLLGAWLGCLWLVRRLTTGMVAADRCLAVVVVGWTPVGVLQTMTEGHNDIVMVFLALLWLQLLFRSRGLAPVALAASAACKYVTAPLLLIDLAQACRVEKMPLKRYAVRLALPVLLTIAVFAPFFRSLNFFDGVLLLSEWRFLQPADAVRAVEQVTGLSFWPLAIAVMAAIPVIGAYYVFSAFRSPSKQNMTEAVIAIMAVMTFAVVSHLWPWYLIWPLAFAALLPRWWLSRLVFGVGILAPFALAFWWLPLLEGHKGIAALAIYSGGLIWTYVTRANAASPNL